MASRTNSKSDFLLDPGTNVLKAPYSLSIGLCLFLMPFVDDLAILLLAIAQTIFDVDSLTTDGNLIVGERKAGTFKGGAGHVTIKEALYW